MLVSNQFFLSPLTDGDLKLFVHSVLCDRFTKGLAAPLTEALNEIDGFANFLVIVQFC